MRGRWSEPSEARYEHLHVGNSSAHVLFEIARSCLQWTVWVCLVPHHDRKLPECRKSKRSHWDMKVWKSIKDPSVLTVPPSFSLLLMILLKSPVRNQGWFGLIPTQWVVGRLVFYVVAMEPHMWFPSLLSSFIIPPPYPLLYRLASEYSNWNCPTGKSIIYMIIRLDHYKQNYQHIKIIMNVNKYQLVYFPSIFYNNHMYIYVCCYKN